jgi:NADPH:quinone reductase
MKALVYENAHTLHKAKTKAFVISTASRPESKAWCLKMGADLVVDHADDVAAQLASADIPNVDMVLSTAKSADNIGWIAKLLRPFGHLSVVDGSPVLDASALMPKAASLHTEMIFSKMLHGYALNSQGAILEAIAAFVAKGRMQPIATTRLDGLTPDTMKTAHGLLETRRTIGKVVIATH